MSSRFYNVLSVGLLDTQTESAYDKSRFALSAAYGMNVLRFVLNLEDESSVRVNMHPS